MDRALQSGAHVFRGQPVPVAGTHGPQHRFGRGFQHRIAFCQLPTARLKTTAKDRTCLEAEVPQQSTQRHFQSYHVMLKGFSGAKNSPDFLNRHRLAMNRTEPSEMKQACNPFSIPSIRLDRLAMKYIPYDAGGKAMAALLSGEIAALSTGFSEAVDLAAAGEVKIIGVTSEERVDVASDAMTLKEQGIDATFVNWRGFFGAPGLPNETLEAYQTALEKMYDTPEWEAVRARNGWVNIHNSGDAFKAFLENQEQVIGDLMKKLGFL
ncbi:tripartite tricarboxylate transporter substrate-binding protein [Phaeobacter sp. PT47_59]|uniref:Bug family tripartite tricarboxylate transporter substrate binding protein n=1 Tax=Phaeobacter sp. PT47_59 TaxID=3029979 RepID=UPI0023809EBD|nr:tripartite tricarboxylate transporter substrate-binding protein [Phaeobacter sp. PT47_59]MDE4176268.1 tripartite tricarboxylate transporter substrate-binding protein [Phaeobacter sp. PT47_59]